MFRLAPATHAVLSLCVGLICCACSEERTETSRGATAQEAAGSEKTQAGAVAPDKPAAPKASAKESPDRDSAARGWRQSWQAFAQTLSRHVQAELEHKQLASQLEPGKAVGWSSEKVAKVFEGATVTWHGEVVGIHKTGGERKIYVVRMPPHPVRLKDEFTITLNSLRLLPEEANAKAWGPVKVGDRVRFRTVLKGEPAMPFLVNPRMVAFDERTERYLDVKRNWREGGPVIQVLHGLTNKSLAERGGSREDTLIMVNTDDAELLNRAAPGTRAPETREGEKAKQERIRVAALK